MSLQNCDATATSGFPIKVIQNIFNPWPGKNPSDNSVNRIIAPMDFSANWAPATNVNIAVRNTPTVFQITGLEPVAGGTTITMGTANYNCSPVLSMIKIQHPNLVPPYAGSPIQEIIQAFQIRNKVTNPSAPDILLFCRPVIVTDAEWASNLFWNAVNEATKTRSAKTVNNLEQS